jgi:hypothetical protein
MACRLALPSNLSSRCLRSISGRSGRIVNLICDYGLKNKSILQIALAAESKCLAWVHKQHRTSRDTQQSSAEQEAFEARYRCSD